MSDDDSITTGERTPLLIADHRIAVLVSATVVIAIIFTVVGLFLYNISGTAQIDLSRPDFEGIDTTASGKQKENFVEYSATGQIDDKSLAEFDALYKKRQEDVKQIDAFGGTPISPESLGIDQQ